MITLNQKLDKHLTCSVYFNLHNNSYEVLNFADEKMKS